MKLVLSLSLLTAMVLTTPAQAQLLCALGPTTKPYDATADATAPSNLQADLKRVKALLCPKGCGKPVVVVNPTAPDALTATTGIGVSEIAFSPKFLAVIKSSYGAGAEIGFVAHQLGHHLDTMGNHPSWMNTGWDGELRADAWAGCALGKADLKPGALQAALSALAAFPPSTHPAWTSRLPAVEAAYAECSGGQSLPALPTAKKEAPVASGAGCNADRDCRNGRVCVAGHCGLASAHRTCGKDTDCPDPQECGADGTCQTPAGAEAAHAPASASGFKPAKATETAPIATADTAPQSAAATKASAGEGGCEKACTDGRDKCLESASTARTQCLATIQSEANYRSCGCPRYPEGNYACYQLCTEAYQRGTLCLSDKKANACQSEASSCLSRCQDSASSARE